MSSATEEAHRQRFLTACLHVAGEIALTLSLAVCSVIMICLIGGAALAWLDASAPADRGVFDQ